jgi:hypothetical protein
MWQIFIRVSGPSKKPISENMSISQAYKKKGPKNKKIKVVKLGYLVVLVKREKCCFQHVPFH